MPYHNQQYGYTPRDLLNGSGIYFRPHTRDLTERDNEYYTPEGDTKKRKWQNENPSERDGPVSKPRYRTFTKIANLPLVRVSYKAHILSTTTRTVLTQSFYHPGNEPIDEATYSFPLYAGCSVVSFVCLVGPKKIITGVVQPKKVAKATYEKAKSQGHTAGLLEEFTPEVFKTSLGNIPAGVTVRVEITYLTELKHDTKVDGIRFTVPTSIAPRYGDPPEGLFGDEYETRAEKGVSFSIDVTMGGRIRTIESPSHGVSVQLGSHRAANPANQYDDKKALVTLSQSAMHLGRDFVILITTATPKFLCTPMALLETHPAIPGQQALMVTLVPRFAAPKSTQKREIIFIVDRSGSMEPMIPPLKSAVSVFIKSLPIGCKFNICLFGSYYSFLWEESQDYSAHTVKAALNLVDDFYGEMGGTELLQPIQETVKRRQEDMNTEVIVLTDGEIWEEGQALEFIKQATKDSKGKLRFFSIGLGSQVSHSLVEGIARTGGGYSQIVADGSDEQDAGGWEGKVVKMLKAALTEHVDDYSLKVIHEGFHETDEEDSDEEEESTSLPVFVPSTSNARKSTTAFQAPKKLSLFDPDEDLDMTPETPSDDELPVGRTAGTADPSLSEDRFSHLKRLENPEILQAPYQIPPLYPQVRTVAYLLISPTGDRLLRNPTSVKLQGTASGVQIEQSIPITRLDEPGLTIHQLAARMALRDLEDGSSWLHSGKYEINPEDDTFPEYVEREGESLSIKWGLASKWASFVAVEDELLGKTITKAYGKKSQDEESNSSSDVDDGDGDRDHELPDCGSGTGPPKTTFIKTPVTDRSKNAVGTHSLGHPSAPMVALSLAKAPPPLASARKIPGAFSIMHAGHDSMSMLLQPRDKVADDDWNQLNHPSPQFHNSYPGPSSSSPMAVAAGYYGTAQNVSRPALDDRHSEGDHGTGSMSRGEYEDYAMRCPVTPSSGLRFGYIHDSRANEYLPDFSEQKLSHNGVPRSSNISHQPIDLTRVGSCAALTPLCSRTICVPTTPHQRVIRIIHLQEFKGSFPATKETSYLIGLELPDVEKLAKELFPDKETDESEILVMTSLIVAYLELEMHEHEDIWQLVVEKAREFVEEGCEWAKALKEKAEGIIKKVLKGDEDLRVGDSAY